MGIPILPDRSAIGTDARSAMKGRKPKSKETRQRRNKSTSAATLPSESESAQLKVPPLPKKDGGWTAPATAAWARIWRAPMAARYLKADHYRIEILIDMVDRYWRGDTALAAQIRLEGDSFATSPLARRRLEWEVRDHDAVAEQMPIAAATAAAGPRPKGDPRKVLAFDGGDRTK
jgi:hypothetical protein